MECRAFLQAHTSLDKTPSPAAFYDDIASEFKLPYESAALKSILTDNSLKSDLVHPNAKGYARLAEAIHAVIRKSGAI